MALSTGDQGRGTGKNALGSALSISTREVDILPKLVVNPTSGNKKEVSIASRVISIGRDPSNDLVLSDSMVSRRHAILEQRDDVFVLRDNGSANGTLVNGDGFGIGSKITFV